MADMSKISSFKTFTQLKSEETAAKLAEERSAKRTELANKLSSLLDEMDIASFDELDEETMDAFLGKAFGNVSEEDESEEAEEESIEEGNAFIYAASKAKAEGKDEFEFNGKTYKVTLKADTGLRESEEVLTEAKKLDKKGTIAIAQKIADIFTQESADEKEYIKYTVNPNVSSMSFDLDAEPTNKTPKKIADNPNYFGEYAGGSLYIKDNGEEFVVYNAAVGSAEIESFTYDGKLIESVVNEAIVVTGKRAAKTVMNTYVKFFEKFPALGRNAMGVPVIHHMGAVKELYVEAMTDANFSREIPATKSAMKGRVFPVNIKAAELGNTTITVSAGKLMDICATHGSAISGAAKFSGMAIVEGTAMYLDSIGKTKEAEDLMAKFNKAMANESNDVRVDVEAKLNEAAALNEGEKEEQDAMELYTQVAGPKGAYSEDELAKADMDLFMEIVTAAGHKGSKAKKIADEFRKIATMESTVTEAKKFYSTKEIAKMSNTAGDIVVDAKYAIQDLGVEYGDKVPAKELDRVLAEYDLELKDVMESAVTEASLELSKLEDAIKMFQDKIEKQGRVTNARDEEHLQNLIRIYKEMGGKNIKESAVTEASLELSKLEDAIKMFQDKIEKQGRVTNARDEEHLQNLIRIYKEMGGKNIKESVVNEAEIKSDEEFQEYAFTVLKKAFGDDFDEAKAQEVIDGLTSKYGEDYGAMVGALQSSLG
jgi:hypothetical protein